MQDGTGDQATRKRRWTHAAETAGESPEVGGRGPMRADGFPQGASRPLHLGSPPTVLINYLSRSSHEKLRLLQGEGDSLGQILQLLTEYEGVLARQESFAANLGGKLTTPRLIKAVESAFEGPILTSPPQTSYTPHPVRWPDIIQYARANPHNYAAVLLPGGGRVYRFHLKGVQVEVGEDDWGLIATGALDGMIPEGPLEEDEAAELATADILEARLEGLVREAEEVARRARNLVFALDGRRRGILARREGARRGPSRGFPTVNIGAEDDGARRASATQGGKNGGREGAGVARGEAGDLHASLLQQFKTSSPTSGTFDRPAYTMPRVGTAPPRVPAHAVSPGPSQSSPRGTSYLVASPTSRYPPLAPSGRLPAPPPPARKAPATDDADAAYRPLIASMVEALGRGEEISPPCDRCRRLGMGCVKHLTACQGCTRKHAKCTWGMATEGEVAGLRVRRQARRRGGERGVADGDAPAMERKGAVGILGAVDRAGPRIDGVEARAEGEGKGDVSGTRTSGNKTPLLRMDIDSITTQQASPPRETERDRDRGRERVLPTTRLPRDPNLLDSPTQAAGESATPESGHCADAGIVGRKYVSQI
ncbi:uncharacterized protein DNG_06493 [Cephalotrichum gorgonifer]|uniref:Zn(2)-C6 fungal-type domain-containing protein n=1 Tax=Cephalotrichum gorgonifer TaxID=2041049 RepID=A0AAE8SWH5_9PEZI|nr:uncharacterized protein DNG_06493 [Cephalotrichum gorgonifer]